MEITSALVALGFALPADAFQPGTFFRSYDSVKLEIENSKIFFILSLRT